MLAEYSSVMGNACTGCSLAIKYINGIDVRVLEQRSWRS